MEAIKKTVDSIMQDLAEKKAATGDQTSLLIKKVLTKNELAHIKCNYFRNGILGILVDSSAVYYKLNLKKSQLLSALNVGPLEIKDIHFRMGEI